MTEARIETETFESGSFYSTQTSTYASGTHDSVGTDAGSVSVREVTSSGGGRDVGLMRVNFRLTGRHVPLPGNTTGAKQR